MLRIKNIPSLYKEKIKAHLKKTPVRLGIFFTICASSFYFYKADNVKPLQPKSVYVEKVSLTPLYKTVTLQGIVKAKKQAMLKAKESGILRILKTSGTTVQKDEVIAILENQEADQKYDLYQQAENIAKDQYVRTEKLFKAGVASQNALEDKKNAYVDAQTKLANAKVDREKNQIIAPFHGIVGMFKYQDGEEIQTQSEIVSLYDDSSFKIDFDIPHNLAKKLPDNACILYDGKEMPIIHDPKILDPDTKMCSGFAKIPCVPFPIGAIVPIDLIVNKKENAILVPFRSIFLKDGCYSVYKAVDHKVDMASIEIGERFKDQIEVIKGLAPDDLLITQGIDSLYPTQVINETLAP
ncbi:MAG: hypothetical protein CNLJKLNK_01262 [Holosporales bacterium]